jgi:tetratricopeptide (TPR) repeat protein
MRTKSIFTLLAAVVLALSGHAAWSQATLTRAEGKVTNAGKPMPDVQVVLTYQDNGKQFKIKTDKSGAFVLIGLTRGAYTVEVFNASGQSLYQKKNQSLTGEGGAVDHLDIDVAGEGGNSGQPKMSAAEVEAIKAQNAKAQSINALIAQYNAAMTAKNWADAIPPLQAMIASDPNRWDYIQALGNMQSNSGDSENAASSTDSANAASHADKAKEYYASAVQTYDKGIQVAQGYVSGATPKDPKNPMTEPAKAKAGMGQMYASQGNAYLKLKKNSDAVAAYTKAAELDPNPGVAYFNICATQYNAGNTEGALAACDKAIAADPTKADAYFIKGSLLIASSSLDKEGKVIAAPGTSEALNKYLELAPDGPHANDVKQMLTYIGSKVDTSFKSGKKK